MAEFQAIGQDHPSNIFGVVNPLFFLSHYVDPNLSHTYRSNPVWLLKQSTNSRCQNDDEHNIENHEKGACNVNSGIQKCVK